MRIQTLSAFFFLALSSLSFATDLNLSAQSSGSSQVTVLPGAVVPYEIRGELSDASSDGLALFLFDLSFNGGALSQASTPAAFPMLNFAKPLGITNPAGYGGTVQGGVLRQVGGGQNTINNFFATYPSGSVTTHVAQAGSPQILVSGTITAPTLPGSYTLSISNVIANVIRQGETGFPFWKVEEAGVGSVSGLEVNVAALVTDVSTLSIGNPGVMTFSLNAGPSKAGRPYYVLGSVSGTSPGLALPLTTIPLNYDWYLDYTIYSGNGPILGNTIGNLDGSGQATATLTLPSGLDPGLQGFQLHHAFVLINPINYSSNPVTLTLTL